MEFDLGEQRPLLLAIAGPNGAGKSTFHEQFIRPLGMLFVNADEIARELNLTAYAAAESAARVRAELLARGESFVFETVLSDPAGEKVEFLRRAAEEQSYTMMLCFVGIDSAATSNERVFIRVTEGGHDVPEEKLLALFPRTMANLARAIRALPRVYVFDNSDDKSPYRFVAEFEGGRIKRRADHWPEWFKAALGL